MKHLLLFLLIASGTVFLSAQTPAAPPKPPKPPKVEVLNGADAIPITVTNSKKITKPPPPPPVRKKPVPPKPVNLIAPELPEPKRSANCDE